MRLFKHNLSGKYYRLVIQRDSEVNTYIEVNENDEVAITKASWTHGDSERKAIIMGFDKLTEIKTK